jgi:hypothetical protein
MKLGVKTLKSKRHPVTMLWAWADTLMPVSEASRPVTERTQWANEL